MPALLSRLRAAYPSLAHLTRPLYARFCDGGPDDQLLRIVMNRETERLVAGLDPAARRTLEISGQCWNRPGLFKTYVSKDFPEYDVCERALDERFDLIIAEQVFEHLLWPYRAARHVHQMLAPGGAFLITTPFMVRIHEHPIDCSRWTELGLKHFLAECGFPLDTIETGSWGNRDAVINNLERWQVYRPGKDSLVNDSRYPTVVWALAKV
jgi:SAM-dependent methyltransferase